jgi:hypothetical protein
MFSRLFSNGVAPQAGVITVTARSSMALGRPEELATIETPAALEAGAAALLPTRDPPRGRSLHHARVARAPGPATQSS